jgi:ABC-2 type transport system ATP-binding protein
VLGVDVSRDPLAVRRRVGFMPEVDATIPGLSGTELVAYAAELSGIPRGASLQRAHEALAWAGLKEERYRPVGGYSTGMRQRLRLAQAIVHDPELVFLDEPTDGLDPRGREAMLSLIESLPGEHGIHVVLSSHLLKDVERVCKEAVLLRAGRVIGAGRVADMTGGQQGLYDVVLRGERRRFAAELAERGGLLIEAGPGRDRVRLSGPSTTRPIVEAAAASGVQLRRLVPSRLSLEDAFLAAMSPETSERGAAHADS